MKRACEGKGIWVYVYRDTIENGYTGDDNLARVLVKKEWLEEYAKEISERRFKDWLDFYIADETIDLFERASKDGAVLKVDLEKQGINENYMEKDLLGLTYEAMRLLEIAGKVKEANEMIDKVTQARKKSSYSEIKELIKEYVDIQKEKDGSAIRVGLTLNVFSVLNPWIDFIINVEDDGNIKRAKIVINNALSDWFDGKEDVGDKAVFEYIYGRLKAEGIKSEIYTKICDIEEEE